MFDIGIGYSELLLIAVVLIIVVGPEELPGVLRTIGRYVGQVKSMADDFRSQFDEALRETELDKLKDEVGDIGDSMKGVVESLDDPFGEEDLIDFEEHNRKILEEEQKRKAAGESLGDMGGMEPAGGEPGTGKEFAGGEKADADGETAVQKALREGGMPEMGADPDNVISGLGETPARSANVNGAGGDKKAGAKKAGSKAGKAAKTGKNGKSKKGGVGKKSAKAGAKAKAGGKKRKKKIEGEIELAAGSGSGH